MLVRPPYGTTELCPVRALSRWLDAPAIGDGAVFDGFERRRSPLRKPPALLVIGSDVLTTRSIDRIVQICAVAAGFADREFGGHSLKRGTLSAGIRWRASGAAQAAAAEEELRRAWKYLELGNLIDGHPLSDVLYELAVLRFPKGIFRLPCAADRLNQSFLLKHLCGDKFK